MYHCYLVLLLLVIGLDLAMAIPGPPSIRGFDLSERQYTKDKTGDPDLDEQRLFWNCTFGKGFGKVVIRGYRVM